MSQVEGGRRRGVVRRGSSLVTQLTRRRRKSYDAVAHLREVSEARAPGSVQKRRSKRLAGPLRNVTNETRIQMVSTTKKRTRLARKIYRDQQAERRNYFVQTAELQQKLEYLTERQRDASLDLAMLSANSGEALQAKFAELTQVGCSNTIEAATQPVNTLKNRYRNILPYDHSLVALRVDKEFDEASGYINANYIHGYLKYGAYIATQGPLEATTNTFWRMVWEHESEVIVMLTNIQERGQEKCWQYWPEPQVIGQDSKRKYGRIAIRCVSMIRQDAYTTRTFMLKMGRKTRQVRHFQYTNWPDRTAPDCTDMADFANSIGLASQHGRDAKPIVVHCSAGVGRSGTFIAIDQMMQRLDKRDPTIDIVGMVSEMRLRRCNMVQNVEQFSFLFRFLVSILGEMVEDTKTQKDSLEALQRVADKQLEQQMAA